MAFRSGFPLARCIGRVCRTSLASLAHSSRFSSSAWLENDDSFYWGPKIFNQVTWTADGHPIEAQASHAYSVGHQRLWNFIHGKVLDIGRLNVGQRCIFTTAQSGTFYLTIKHGVHWVTLVIDGREGWCYGLKNKKGTFEFRHTQYPHIKYMKGSRILRGVEGNYGDKGLCPDGILNVSLGYLSVEEAVKVLSDHGGEDPVPEEVRKACATLLIYGPESVKLYQSFYAASSSLQMDTISLGALNVRLPRRLRKWNTMSDSLLHASAASLNEGVFVPARPSSVSGVCTIEDLLDEVAIIPFNRTIDPIVHQLKRNWQAFPPDKDAHLAAGKAHYRSKDFVPRPSPIDI